MTTFRSSNFDKLLDKATSNLHLEPDWSAILNICDLIRQGDVQPKIALAAIKKKLINSNTHVAYYGLLVLESCVKNCGSLIHDEIGTKQYMEQLKELVKTSPHDNVKQKTLELIQAWAYAFRNNSKYRAVQDTVNIMKQEGYKFPALKESDAMFSADTAPEWADSDVCHRCRVGFTILQRKHHCRACGQVFCAQCSSKVSTLPKFGIEKEVRVCEACYDQINKPSSSTPKETDLPAEYLSSSLAQQQQVPPRKSTEELQEEEELQLALALSQSEAEQKEKEKKRATSAMKMNSASTARTYSPPASPVEQSPLKLKDEETDPELALYLNRKYWEQKQNVMEEQSTRTNVASPSAPNIISSPMPQKIVVAKQQNGKVESEMEDFVEALKSQVEIFVNRMKSNSSRGRSIANDSSVQGLFLNITAMHSRLLGYIQEQDDSRVHYEQLQDKLTQIKDARAALDALREEHREKLHKEAEEAERQRQLLMAQKLEIMRKKKQEYLQYQRQLALQRIQEQEREMQMRQEQQKQQYIMGGYQQVPGYMGPSQNSPVRHMQYQNPAANYNHPMSPTNQGVFMYGQPGMMNQYPMQGYNMPQMGAMPGHVMGSAMPSQEQKSDPTAQARESLGRVSISGPNMQLNQAPMQQVPQPNGPGMAPGSQPGMVHSQVAPPQVPAGAGHMQQPGGQPMGMMPPPGMQMGMPQQQQIGPPMGQMPQNQPVIQQNAGPQQVANNMGGMPPQNQQMLPPMTQVQNPPTPQITNATTQIQIPVQTQHVEPPRETKPETAELISFD